MTELRTAFTDSARRALDSPETSELYDLYKAVMGLWITASE